MEENILYKRCNKCKEEKPLSEFSKCNDSKDNLKYYCRDCEKVRVKLWLEKNKEKIKESRKIYYQNNKEKIYKKSRQWYKNNEDKMKEYYKEYNKEYQKEYYKKHKKHLKK